MRGGLALAMAMAIPPGVVLVPEINVDLREVIVLMAYSVVVFSILIQGSTVSGMIHRANKLQEKLLSKT